MLYTSVPAQIATDPRLADRVKATLWLAPVKR
jgi:hypothetical protein